MDAFGVFGSVELPWLSGHCRKNILAVALLNSPFLGLFFDLVRSLLSSGCVMLLKLFGIAVFVSGFAKG